MNKYLAAGEDVGVSPVERGRRQYLQKDYRGALEAFSEVRIMDPLCMAYHMASVHLINFIFPAS